MQQPNADTDADLASFGARVVAFLIDVVIVAAVAFAVLVGLAIVADGMDNPALDLEDDAIFVLWLATGLVWEVLWIAGPTRGKPGQLMSGFRVVRPDGGRVSPGRAIVRWTTRVLSLVVFPFGLIAQFLTLAASQRNQALHDVFADTVCVRRSAILEARSVQHVPTAAEHAAPTMSPIDTNDHARTQGPFL